MARQRKKKGRPVSGWVILDKPEGLGSTQAVAKVKWLFGAAKAGHAGTLDPLASGMLPIALGEATKTVPYVVDGTKIYRFSVAWGEERTTDDLEGEVSERSDARPTEGQVRAILSDYIGTIMQVPPQFSAIKIAGERAYDIAREGTTVDMPAREVEIFRFEILKAPDADTTVFEIECGKGTYVRSLARDMGRQLGCYGHVSLLRRVEVAPFEEGDLVSLETLEAARREIDAQNTADGEDGPPKPLPADAFAPLDVHIVDAGAALEDLPHVALADDAAARVRSGNAVILRGRDAPVEAPEAYATARGRLVAIGEIEAGQFHPRRVFAA